MRPRFFYLHGNSYVRESGDVSIAQGSFQGCDISQIRHSSPVVCDNPHRHGLIFGLTLTLCISHATRRLVLYLAYIETQSCSLSISFSCCEDNVVYR